MKAIKDFSNSIAASLKPQVQTVKKDDIGNLSTESASIVYVAYNQNDEPIYVGETSKTLKRRFLNDGSGAHKGKKWFNNLAYVKYVALSEEELPTKERKLLEQAFSIYYKPKF